MRLGGLRAMAGLAMIALVAGCAHGKPPPDTTRCPEYRDLVCFTGVSCAYDSERGCRICQCDKPGPDIQDSSMPSTLYPDHR